MEFGTMLQTQAAALRREIEVRRAKIQQIEALLRLEGPAPTKTKGRARRKKAKKVRVGRTAQAPQVSEATKLLGQRAVLGDLVLRALLTDPAGLRVGDLITKVREFGWVTESSRPERIVSAACGRLRTTGLVETVVRGRFTLTQKGFERARGLAAPAAPVGG